MYKINVISDIGHTTLYRDNSHDAVNLVPSFTDYVEMFDRTLMMASLKTAGVCEYSDAHCFLRITKIP